VAQTAIKSNRVDALIRNLRKEGPVVLLESQLTTHPGGKKSFIAGHPRKILKVKNGLLTINESGSVKKVTGNSWNLLKDQILQDPEWYFGYLGYDLKNDIEELTSQNADYIGAADLFFMVPDFLMEIDHQKKRYTVLRDRKNRDVNLDSIPGSYDLGELKLSIRRSEYLKKVDTILELIKEGDLYEMNFAHQSYSSFYGDPYSVYTQMRQEGPVPFGAYLYTGDLDICCASPERFLAKKGRKLISQPMKGTTGRGKTDEEDGSLRENLATSKKEQAENLMIVDLVRHDLNKIAVSGSVKATRLFEIQEFPTVHQMVSTIEAETAIKNPADILKECFPMGSMTGAPKIRAMQRIEELETFKRGVYSGAIGYITPENDFDFNVVIRTAIIKQNRLFYAAGGAITGDSNAEEEWQETLLKKKALTNII